MTFKHVKFEDSPVMRSLEKVAQQKGMIKNDPVVKTAGVKQAPTSLIPSDNFVENVMKLCAGLRQRGFVKQAEDVENNLIAYKQAQTLYGVSGEKGEDLIEFAHPEGSHKLENVDSSEAVVEDILDQMLKSIEMVQKKPTGKLSESQKAIEAVKVILGAPPLDVKALYAQAQDALQKFREVAGSIALKMGEKANYDSTYLDEIKNVLDDGRVQAVGDSFGSAPFSQVLTTTLDNLRSSLEPSYFNLFGGGPSAWSPLEQQNWQEVQKYFPVLKKYSDRFQNVVSQIEHAEGSVVQQQEKQEVQQIDPEGSADALISNLQNLLGTIDGDITKIRQKGLTNANDLVSWLTDKAKPFGSKALQQFSNSDKSEQATAAAQQQYDTLKSKINAFERRWLA